MFDIFDNKQMYDRVFKGEENGSKDWNCILSMFLTSYNIYFVIVYVCFICMCFKSVIWLFLDKVWLFWFRQVGNPAGF